MILSFDTCNGSCSVAIATNNQVIDFIVEQTISKQAESLFTLIHKLFARNKLSYSDINHLAINIGPGSFTGVRIGLAAAKGIAIASKIKLIAVTGFEALSADVQNSLPKLLVMNARSGQVYYNYKGQQNIGSYQDVANLINEEIFITGDGSEFIFELLTSKNIKFHYGANIIDAKSVALAASCKHKDYDFSSQVNALYLRPAYVTKK